MCMRFNEMTFIQLKQTNQMLTLEKTNKSTSVCTGVSADLVKVRILIQQIRIPRSGISNRLSIGILVLLALSPTLGSKELTHFLAGQYKIKQSDKVCLYSESTQKQIFGERKKTHTSVRQFKKSFYIHYFTYASHELQEIGIIITILEINLVINLFLSSDS